MLVCIAVTGNLSTQDKVASRAFYTELGGASVLYSVNIDGRFKSAQHLGFGYRVGLGYVRTRRGNGWNGNVIVPFGFNYLLGKSDSPHIFEISSGGSFGYNSAYGRSDNCPGCEMFGYIGFAYRKQPLDGGVMWKAGITTIIIEHIVIPLYPSFSFGYAF